MAVHSSRRLPGFRFEVQAPPLLESLPRMDVAVFVGFAAAGPLNVPVPVEDAIHFAAIFGDDVPLAWDSARGETVYGYLAPTVRAFFRNGGRRCWIVRVADNPQYNYFPIPGLMGFDTKTKQISPAFARSRSEGSWSDSVGVGATLFSRSVQVLSVTTREQPDHTTVVEVDVDPVSARRIVEGDLLRLTYRDVGYVLFLALHPQTDASTAQNASSVRFTSDKAVWLRMGALAPSVTSGEARMHTHDGEGAPIPARLIHHANETPDQPVTILLDISADKAPEPGSTISFSADGLRLWLSVETSRFDLDNGSPPNERVEVTGRGLWWETAAPAPQPAGSPEAEILSLELLARSGGEYPQRVSDLGFHSRHSRFWGGLPTDYQLFSDAQAWSASPYVGLAQDAASGQRFPLAGDDVAGNDVEDSFYFPLAMSAIAENFLRADANPLSSAERDGLARFGPHLFLDSAMVDVGATALIGQADFIMWQSASPRLLTGIHAALSIEEATMIAVPDAVHRGWRSANIDVPQDAEVSPPIIRPEWWHFLGCDPDPIIEAISTSMLEKGQFHNSDLRIIEPPNLKKATPDPTGTFTLRWTWPNPSNAQVVSFVLEEAALPNFAGATAVYTGRVAETTIYGRPQGDYYYRVRAVMGPNTSDWSNGRAVRVATAVGLELLNPGDFSDLSMLAVQRALLRMCAARGDMLAVFTLPEHYRDAQAISHVTRLKSPLAGGIEVVYPAPDRLPGGAPPSPPDESSLSLPFDSGEAAVFSYAALYHPWLVDRPGDAQSDLRSRPPDGAAIGILAARSLSRGAWVAPANERLNGVVALTPTITSNQWQALQDAQVNVFRQEPRGFMSLSADTLSDDPDLRPINVRRLLMLLRRLALREGSTWLFEPNDDSFRRLVQRNFEALLADMFQRGAFAGGTSDRAYQVVTGPSLNTPRSMEQGRFIVELRVAPSLPMTFITIRLVQTGDRTLVTEGR